MLLSLRNITEHSTYNKSTLSSDLMGMLAENHDFPHVANLRHIMDLLFCKLQEN